MIRVYPFFSVESASYSFLICDILFVELLKTYSRIFKFKNLKNRTRILIPACPNDFLIYPFYPRNPRPILK
jgi:hypothetical protein